MWTGSLSFGLVNVPVKMYAATENHSVSFHQVHAADGGRIRMKRICSIDGEEVPYAEIAKGYETADGRRVVLRAEDFVDLPRAPKKEIEVLEFVPEEQVDPILFDKSYYLEPDGRALKPYVLLRAALESTERTAIVKVALRERTQLGCLRIHDGVLVLQTMLWPDEVREPEFEFLGEDVDIRPQELSMAQSLIANLSADFDAGQYSDEYREAVLALIEDKLSGGEAVAVADEEAAPGGAGVVELMAALRASVEETGGRAAESPANSARKARRRGEGAGHTPRPPAQKTAASKRTAASSSPTAATAKSTAAMSEAKRAAAKEKPPTAAEKTAAHTTAKARKSSIPTQRKSATKPA